MKRIEYALRRLKAPIGDDLWSVRELSNYSVAKGKYLTEIEVYSDTDLERAKKIYDKLTM